MTFSAVKDMKVSQVRRIRELKLPKERHSAVSKERMLADLFPKEQREADAVLAHDQEREHKRHARKRLREIDLIREQVRICILIGFQIGIANPRSGPRAA